jgi:hypothetical protein
MSLDEQRTGEIAHTNKLGEQLVVLPEAPDDISGLREHEQTVGDTAKGTDALDAQATVTTAAERKKKWHQRTGVRIAGAVLAASLVVPTTIAVVASATHSEVGAPNPGEPIPEPGSPNYDPFQKIGNNSEITIGDVDRLLGYFNSGEIKREALIAALAQASQQEVNRIFEVMVTPDAADNIEVTTILNSYGLETNEIPRDLMGSISEINSLVEQDVDIIAHELYPDIPYDDIKTALSNFTADEAEVALAVINGTGSIVDLNNILRSHGVELGDGYLS